MENKELPKYRCIKEVHALKIKSITSVAVPMPGSTGCMPVADGAVIEPEEEGYSPIKVGIDFITKHKPYPGGYYVLYEDGYASFSPAEPFEKGYLKIDK